MVALGNSEASYLGRPWLGSLCQVPCSLLLAVPPQTLVPATPNPCPGTISLTCAFCLLLEEVLPGSETTCPRGSPSPSHALSPIPSAMPYPLDMVLTATEGSPTQTSTLTPGSGDAGPLCRVTNAHCGWQDL